MLDWPDLGHLPLIEAAPRDSAVQARLPEPKPSGYEPEKAVLQLAYMFPQNQLSYQAKRKGGGVIQKVNHFREEHALLVE